MYEKYSTQGGISLNTAIDFGLCRICHSTPPLVYFLCITHNSTLIYAYVYVGNNTVAQNMKTHEILCLEAKLAQPLKFQHSVFPLHN